MCCLFGLLDYKHHLPLEERQRILRALSVACEARGKDATGIAYFKGSDLYIQKAPKTARRMRLKLSQDAFYIMGHTRMTTQGNEKLNYNNHPFSGHANRTAFALAHNGVIHNDKALRKAKKLPSTKIETDSYVAVQLLEKDGVIDFESLRYMAEALEGSFTITVLDARNDLYIVKGNNPLCLYHFEDEGYYLYASTQEILDAALRWLGMNKRPHQRVELCSGDILRISADGSRKRSFFNDAALWSMARSIWPVYSLWGFSWAYDPEEPPEYHDMLSLYAQISGYDVDTLERLHEAGYDLTDIEQMIYDPDLMEACMAEVVTANSC